MAFGGESYFDPQFTMLFAVLVAFLAMCGRRLRKILESILARLFTTYFASGSAEVKNTLSWVVFFADARCPTGAKTALDQLCGNGFFEGMPKVPPLQALAKALQLQEKAPGRNGGAGGTEVELVPAGASICALVVFYLPSNLKLQTAACFTASGPAGTVHPRELLYLCCVARGQPLLRPAAVRRARRQLQAVHRAPVLPPDGARPVHLRGGGLRPLGRAPRRRRGRVCELPAAALPHFAPLHVRRLCALRSLAVGGPRERRRPRRGLQPRAPAAHLRLAHARHVRAGGFLGHARPLPEPREGAPAHALEPSRDRVGPQVHDHPADRRLAPPRAPPSVLRGRPLVGRRCLRDRGRAVAQL
mmetsp:Transcript_35910/g.71080  ORF Transcript_35910/g.71080 Transcript_35910/m.71080 type:complete len:359 (+) Transcript_35910:3-1079(+)